MFVVSPVFGRVFSVLVEVEFAPLVSITVNFFSSWTADEFISFSLDAKAVLILAIMANLLKWSTVNCKLLLATDEGTSSIELSSLIW